MTPRPGRSPRSSSPCRWPTSGSTPTSRSRPRGRHVRCDAGDRKVRIRPFALLAALLLLPACQVSMPSLPTAKVVPAPGGAAVEALYGGFPGPLNPLFEAEDNARDIDSLIYEGLTTIQGDQSVVPLLARGWTISDDRLSYTFVLRDDVRWADGQRFGADDVMFTFQVLGSPDYDQAPMQVWKEIRIARLGEHQVRFTLKAPRAS